MIEHTPTAANCGGALLYIENYTITGDLKIYKKLTNNFESHNSLKLRFMNIQRLPSNFVDCESFLESNSCDILALCETNLDDSIDSGNFSVEGFLVLI